MSRNARAIRAVALVLKFAIAAVLVFAFAWGVVMLTGCGRERSVYVPKGTPLVAHFDPKDCRYLRDGVSFTCKHTTFEPRVINVKDLQRKEPSVADQNQQMHDKLMREIETCSDAARCDLLRQQLEAVDALITETNQADFKARTSEFISR